MYTPSEKIEIQIIENHQSGAIKPKKVKSHNLRTISKTAHHNACSPVIYYIFFYIDIAAYILEKPINIIMSVEKVWEA